MEKKLKEVERVNYNDREYALDVDPADIGTKIHSYETLHQLSKLYSLKINVPPTLLSLEPDFNTVQF